MKASFVKKYIHCIIIIIIKKFIIMKITFLLVKYIYIAKTINVLMYCKESE